MIEDFSKRGIELCLAVYRITDKFPKDEILRNKLRATSVDINEFLIYNKINPAYSSRVFDFDLEKKLKLFSEYCSIAEKQGWVQEENFRILLDEYKRLYDDLLGYWNKLASTGPDLPAESLAKAGHVKIRKIQLQKRNKAEHKNHNLSERQEQIIKFLKKGNSEGSTIDDLAEMFGISKKTIERDLKLLIGSKLVYKEGQTRSAKFFSKI